MAKLTMNTPGSSTPREAVFVPPKQQGISKWILAAGAAVFLAMFTGLVVTTTLLLSQQNQTVVEVAETATALEEPSLPDLTNAVTRQEMSLLKSETEEAIPAIAAPVLPQSAEVEPEAPAPIAVAAATRTPLRLGVAHRYRVPSCVDYLDTLVKITTVNFPLGSDIPVAADMIRARNIATAVKTCDEVKVVVEGHSDRRGTAQLNMDLSWFRAQSVIDQLQREGYDISALQPRGFGATRPVNFAGTISGEAENRRVQFTLAPRSAPTTVSLSGN
ncbi:OmpA family protein [Tateyamaria sp. Alg231-49]|uniref:OmpA family protein n=1 Tax=Tateyamaria sp. Alg231-49 TaxID=1922219 RepID=UPI00131F1096|nr:OmpA family protein [Tateyamaria sp. Alg231-49]